MFQTDLTFVLPSILYKKVKFDLILIKNVRLQIKKEVKYEILESLMSNCNAEDALIFI